MFEMRQPPLVWVIADDQPDQERIARWLQGIGVAVRKIAAAEAFSDGGNLPSLVIVSMAADKTRGLEFCRRFARVSDHLEIPLLLASPSFADVDFRVAAIESGASVCLVHPVIEKELLAHVQHWLQVTAQAHPLTRIRTIEAALSRAASAEEVAIAIVRGGARVLGTSSACVALLDESSSELQLLHSQGLPESVVQQFKRFPLDAPSPLADCLRRRKPIVWETRAAFDASYPELAWIRIAGGDGAQVAVPMEVQGRLVGGICWRFPHDRRFSKIDVCFLETVMGQCGQAMERARLYDREHEARIRAEAVEQKLRENERQLEQRVERRTRELAASERKMAEALDLLDTLQDSAPVGLAFLDREFHYLRVNKAFEQIHGKPQERLRGRTVAEMVPSLWPDLEPLLRQVLESGKPVLNVDLCWRTPGPSESPRYLLGNYFPVRSARGISGVGVMVTETTQLKAAEQAQREGERRFRAILEQSFDCVQLVSANGEIRYASPSSTSLLGLDPDQLDGQSIFDRIHPDDLPQVQRRFQQLLQAPRATLTSIHRQQHTNGRFHWLEQRATNLLDDADVQAVVINFRDITQDKCAKEVQQKLRKEHAALLKRLQVQVERMPIGLIMEDANRGITDWNPAAERIFGLARADVLGKRSVDLGLVPESAQEHVQNLMLRLMNGDMAAHSVNENFTSEGRSITCEWFNTPLLREDGAAPGVLSMVVDVTERKQLEEQFRQAQKMEAVGTLAGGVAHDFNNLLTVINGCSEMLVDELDRQGELRLWAQDIQRAGERAADLTDQLLSFSRKQLVRQELLDVNQVLANIHTMLARMIGEDVDFQIEPSADLPHVRADKNQLEQVVMNLAVNARDAMPRGGQLRILTSRFTAGVGSVNEPAKTKPTNYVRLQVVDSGEGMDEATLERIFEPFFTTKQAGRGTGLGLATVYGIVMQCGGRLDVRSQPGRGSEFTILLPAVEPLPEQQSSVQSRDPRGGSETILLVEDEDSLRAVAERMLKRLGYQLIVAASGAEALDAARQHRGTIDLLLTDVVMPGMSGGELYNQILTLLPGLRVVFMSGHADDRIVQHGVSEAEFVCLKKPFNKKTLAEKVSRAIKSPPSERRGGITAA